MCGSAGPCGVPTHAPPPPPPPPPPPSATTCYCYIVDSDTSSTGETGLSGQSTVDIVTHNSTMQVQRQEAQQAKRPMLTAPDRLAEMRRPSSRVHRASVWSHSGRRATDERRLLWAVRILLDAMFRNRPSVESRRCGEHAPAIGPRAHRGSRQGRGASHREPPNPVRTVKAGE